MPKLTPARAMAHYKKLNSMRDIAKEHGVGRETVKKMLLERLAEGSDRKTAKARMNEALKLWPVLSDHVSRKLKARAGKKSAAITRSAGKARRLVRQRRRKRA